MKNNKGITLIALVVTIIVLLILAGVSIAMISGNDGILGRATEASWKTDLSNVQDTVNVYVGNYLTDYYAVKYTGSSSTLGVASYTDEDDAVTKACTSATTDTGATVTYTKASGNTKGTISITKDTHSVTGTINGSVVTWGTMQ